VNKKNSELGSSQDAQLKRFSGDFTVFWQQSNRTRSIRIELHGSQLFEKQSFSCINKFKPKTKLFDKESS
jgi:hypothetical protein